MMYQQGDVLIKKVSGVKGKKLSHRVLAEGESTGHKHVVTIGDGDLYEDNGVLYLHCETECTVTHEEHGPVTIPAGDYEIGIVREYDHFAEEARNVAD